MATILNFKKQNTPGDYIITLKLPYLFYRESQAPGIYVQDEIAAFWKKDKDGVYKLSNICPDDGTVWKPYPAGLAGIYRFLNETVTTELPVRIIQTDDFSGIQATEEIKKLGEIKKKLQFYKDYLYEEDINPKNKYLDCNNLKLYFLEKILTDVDEDDVKKIGNGKLILRGINVTLIKKQAKKLIPQKGGEPEKLRTVTSNTIDLNVDYKVDNVKINGVMAVFKSIEENGEKQIAVLYNAEPDCGKTTQRIKKLNKNDTIYFETENEKVLTFCSDWKVVTAGTNPVIRDFGNCVDGLLSSYLKVSVKFIRAQSFNALWNMCKASS